MYFTPTVTNLVITTHQVEQSFALPTDTRKLQISCRGSADDLQIAFIAGDSILKFITIPAGSTYTVDQLYLHGGILVFITSKANDGVTAEILSYS